MVLDIDYTRYQQFLILKKKEGKSFLFDPIRKKDLVLQPEELVRQLVVQYLIHDRLYNKNHIRLEQGLQVNKLNRRCDILIYDKQFTPFLLVECKSSKVKLDQSTFEQIARYNMSLRVKYLLVTNGIQSYCCEMDYENQKYTFLEHVPQAGF